MGRRLSSAPRLQTSDKTVIRPAMDFYNAVKFGMFNSLTTGRLCEFICESEYRHHAVVYWDNVGPAGTFRRNITPALNVGGGAGCGATANICRQSGIRRRI